MLCRSAALLPELIRLPSVNPMGREEPPPGCGEAHVTDWLERWSRQAGLPGVRQPVAPGRENFLVTFDPPTARRSVLLEVHQDTVPVEGMTIDPFGGETRDGRVWGRGACDVKGSLAVVLATLERLKADPSPPPVRVVAAFTVDEEHTFLGVQRLARDLPAVEAGIVFEPTRLEIVETHKGVARFGIETRGRACHSSRPEEGVNAIEAMAKVIGALGTFRDGLVSKPHPRLGPATLSIGTIQGGSGVNIVPDRCRIEIDRRLLPDETATAAREECREFLLERLPSGVQFRVLPLAFDCPPLQTLPGIAPLRETLGAAIDAVRGGHQVIGVPFGTDASSLSQAGLPTLVFGPGDIAQAHTRDEWIEVAQLDQAEAILYQFLQRWGGRA